MPSSSPPSEARGVFWGAFWWALAAILHAGAIAAVIYFTPLRELFFAKDDAGDALAELQGPRVSKFVRELIDIHTRRIREKVEEQKTVLQKLADARDRRYERYVQQTRRPGYKGPAADPIELLGAPGPDANISLIGKDLFELYDAAQAIERTTYGTYRQMRAVELARIQSLPLREALDATQVAVPTHDPIDREVFNQTIVRANDGKLDDLRNELLQIHTEVSSMLSAAYRMLDVAKGLMGDEVGTTITWGSGGMFEGTGSGLWGSDVGPTLAPHEFFPGNTDGMFPADFQPPPGRKLMDAGRRADWMYIDTWYIIGPFPNPQRKYMDHKFPPESTIDLDATYVGKNNVKLQWRFRQSPTLMIAPHVATNYAVWYAWTEIYADRDQARFVAFGSDDYSKAWLNGEPVWTSGKTPHKWIPDRGFRTLHFRRGYNPLLVKWENAGGTTGMSVMIYLGEAPTLTGE